MVSLPPGDSWRPRDGCFCHLGSLARVRLPSAGVIVVELALLVLADRLGGPPLKGYPWEVKTGLRLVRTPGFGGMPTISVASGLSSFVVGDRSMILYVGSLSATLMGYATLYRNFLGGQVLLIPPRPSGLLRLDELADVISQGDSWSRCPLRETLGIEIEYLRHPSRHSADIPQYPLTRRTRCLGRASSTLP